LNSLLEKNLETEAKLSAAEADVKKFKKQLSDYDKTSAKEQEVLMEAANAEMESLRSQHKAREESLLGKVSELEKKVQESSSGSASTRLLLQQLQEAQLELEETSASNMKFQDELLALNQTISVKDKRIAHLEQSKLTQDQMEKIKVLKTERKKYHDDCKVLKKQLQQLKAAYDERELTASNAVAAVSTSDNQVVEKLKDTIREYNKQLREYEEERNGVFRLLERLGFDCSNADQSVSLNDDASVVDSDVLEAVTKLANAFTTLKYSSENQATTTVRVAELENSLAKRTCELMEEISKKTALEKRLESAKTLSKLSKDEATELQGELETLRKRADLLQIELEEARLKAVSSVDSASSEMQSLMEENIELMTENKELRRELNDFKDGLQRTSIQAKKSTPLKKIAPVVATGVENQSMSALNIEAPQLANKSSVQKTIALDHTVNDETASNKVAGRTKIVAKPIAPAPVVQDSDQPGECNQS